MAGSMRKRTDRGTQAWELRIFVGRDSRGRVRHISRLFHGSRRAAERELARLVAEQDREPAIVYEQEERSWDTATTINDAIQAWRDNGWDDLSPSTTKRYKSMWEVHIKDDIGRRKIASLGPYEVERYFRRLKREGLSAATVRQIRAILHRACRLARKWSGGRLPNPVAETELPEWGLGERAKAVRSPDAEEVRRVLAAALAIDSRIGAFIRVVAATGARRGEVCALRREDVDLERATVRIDEGIVDAAGGAAVRSPKTRASIRVVAIDRGTVEVLCDLLTEREALAEACEVSLRPESFIFSPDPGGSIPSHPDTFTHAFDRVRRRAGVAEDVHLHSLRHFQSTELDAVIPERQKQARLGWSTVHMARHYTDAVSAQDRKAADHIGRVLDVRVRTSASSA